MSLVEFKSFVSATTVPSESKLSRLNLNVSYNNHELLSQLMVGLILNMWLVMHLVYYQRPKVTLENSRP